MFDSLKPKFLRKVSSDETNQLLVERSFSHSDDEGHHDKYKMVYWVNIKKYRRRGSARTKKRERFLFVGVFYIRCCHVITMEW